ncbi:DNA-binding transcriptional regulator, LysR family [Paenibacillus algorifonticola]|uniref:DNA-binding transcriptional regulator, LysR family n=1 Tax=Paenibacillus algorifonticola TaxID=684063 RepID=A0A1I1YUJ2_9BACL|nr:LysR family transcriptional regulator [Paenibacillus algorifonticola]SFE23111.1 DNA-binding transcriptional regulator, LysR family [Paenibacillus algorifonticola]
MDIIHLKYFQTVARTEHMTKAANQLNIAQPALSMIISRLEDDLGASLFNRVGRQIRLNEQGKAYLKRVNIALASLEEGRREISALADQEQNRIALAVTTLNRLSKVLSPYLAQYPDVNFRITQASTEQDKLLLLERNEIDFFLTTELISRDDIRHVPLVTEEIMIAVPPTHRLAGTTRISLHEAAQEDFISLKQGYSFREIMDAYCKEAGFIPRTICEGDEPAAIASLVRSGLGIAFQPAGSRGEYPDLSYIEIEKPSCQLTFYLAWMKDRYLSLAAITFREYIIQHFNSLTSSLKDTKKATNNQAL